MEEISTTISFTGHRSYQGETESELYSLMERLYLEGYRTFLSGMAPGFDLAAAKATLHLREQYRDIRLVAVVPYDGFRDICHNTDRELYDMVIHQADRIVTVGDIRGKIGFLQRNNYLIDNSSAVIAWWNGGKKSGTGYTVHRAKRQHKPIYNLHPQPQLDIFAEMQ